MTKKPETVNREDLNRRKDSLIYKKYARVPFTGVFESFHENGQLWERGNYIDGELDGLFEFFHKNGQLDCRENYKNGQREGLREVFYGSSFDRVNWKDGNLHGLCEAYSEDGQLIEKVCFKNGLEVDMSHCGERPQADWSLWKGQ